MQSAKKLIYFSNSLVFTHVEREKRCPLFSLYFLFNIVFFSLFFYSIANV